MNFNNNAIEQWRDRQGNNSLITAVQLLYKMHENKCLHLYT